MLELQVIFLLLLLQDVFRSIVALTYSISLISLTITSYKVLPYSIINICCTIPRHPRPIYKGVVNLLAKLATQVEQRVIKGEIDKQLLVDKLQASLFILQYNLVNALRSLYRNRNKSSNLSYSKAIIQAGVSTYNFYNINRKTYASIVLNILYICPQTLYKRITII